MKSIPLIPPFSPEIIPVAPAAARANGRARHEPPEPPPPLSEVDIARFSSGEPIVTPQRDKPIKLDLINPADWFDVPAPARRWMITNWIPAEGEVTGLYGDGGIGKSFLLQMLQYARALEQQWAGMHVTPGRSLGIYTEDNRDELHRRSQRIIQHLIEGGVDRDYARELIGRVRITSRAGEDNALMTFTSRGKAELTKLHASIIEQALDLKADSVALDNASTMFPGNAINASEVRMFVDYACGGIAKAINGSVVLAAHPSAEGIRSGSGGGNSVQWNAAFRSRLYVEHPKDADGNVDTMRVILSRKKGNYADAESEDKVTLVWHRGILVPEHVARKGRPPAQDVFLNLLHTRSRQGRYVSHKPNSTTYAPKVFAADKTAHGYSKAQFAAVMEDLFRQDFIEVASVKTSQRNKIDAIVLKGDHMG